MGIRWLANGDLYPPGLGTMARRVGAMQITGNDGRASASTSPTPANLSTGD